MSLFHERQIRKANKTHKCCWCGQLIIKGEEYVRQTGVYGGAWFDSKMHLECTEAAADRAESGDFEYIRFSNERPAT